MSYPATIYCDESGNDGPNYVNREQPFYVIAGWVVPNDKIVNAAVEIERFRQCHCNDADELKFKTFKGKPWAVCELMERLGQIGLVPLYVIAEKRYCIAGKIVETFLDPFFNSKIASPFTSDIVTKQQLANTLYDCLSDETLKQFADAYRNPTKSGFETALSRIVAECQHRINPELAGLLVGSLSQLDEIADAEFTAVSSWGKGMGTLNLPCLISFLMIVEQLARIEAFLPGKVVHDEQGPYQDDYRRVFEQHRNGGDGMMFVEGMRVPYSAIRLIENFEIQRSVEQPLIQAADLLAGSITHLATRMAKGEQLRQQEIDLGGLTLPPMLLPDIALALPVCSQKMLTRFGDAIRLAYPNVSSDAVDKNEVDRVQWSGLPGSGPLPLLPERPTESATTRRPDRTVKITLPLFGLARRSDNKLAILLPPDKTLANASVWERIVLLFTNRLAAESFLGEMYWNEPHDVREFDVGELRELVARLREAAEHAEFLRLDPCENDDPPIPIKSLAIDFERLLERSLRASASGIMATLFNRHSIDGLEVDSMLLSSGKYAAINRADGTIGNGDTRENAIHDLMTNLRR